jgi:hypothetical protein
MCWCLISVVLFGVLQVTPSKKIGRSMPFSVMVLTVVPMAESSLSGVSLLFFRAVDLRTTLLLAVRLVSKSAGGN